MGKKRHTQDKLWITYKELSLDWSGKKDTIINQERYLPFDFCSLSLSPFVDPVCDNEGNVYDNKYIIISANMEKVIKFISTLDIKLLDIFKSTYINPDVVMFLDNAFADKGNFFADYYCKIGEEELPIVITNIRLKLQQIIGNINQNSIDNFINKGDR